MVNSNVGEGRNGGTRVAEGPKMWYVIFLRTNRWEGVVEWSIAGNV